MSLDPVTEHGVPLFDASRDLDVYIFSFERASYLKNCIRSINRHLPDCPVTIVDDGSCDAETQDFLEEAERNGIDVIKQSTSRARKTGGLYENMNRSLVRASERGYRYVFFIQDDMQVVRGISSFDSKMISEYFSDESSVQLDTCFRKAKFSAQDEEYLELDRSNAAYRITDISNHWGMKGVTDVGLFHVERFCKKLHSFEDAEAWNEKKALSRGVRVGYYVYPNMMWLPFPKARRAQAFPIIWSLIESLGCAGVYPYEVMSEESQSRLINRDLAQVPIAEEWLNCPSAPKNVLRWSFAGGADNVRARGGWWVLISKIIKGYERLVGYR